VGSRYGDATLKRVVEVTGSKGTWKVLVADATKPALVREVRVRDGRIVSEGKVSNSSRVRTPINVDGLNLDSDGVLATLKLETGEEVPEQLVNYALSTGSDEITPVWTAKVRGGHAEGTTLQIAADTGAILTEPVSPAVVAAGPDDDTRRQESPRRKSESSRGSSIRIPGEIVDEVGNVVRRPVRVVRRFLPF
jgi:hypothetical protein